MDEVLLPRLYAIVDRETLDRRGIGVTVFARELREGGVRLVQYRDKQGGPQEVLRAAAEISAVFAGAGARLVMNDRADLALLAGWSGVHVGHLDMPVEAVRRVVGPNVLIGLSTHNGDQVQAAETWGEPDSIAAPDPTRSHAGSRFPSGMTTKMQESEPSALHRRGTGAKKSDPAYPASMGADYLAIGPVFATASKVDTEPVVGLDGIRRARALTRKPLVAIGGITRANARSVIEAGADSVAVIGGLFAKGESVSAVVQDFLRVLG